MSTMKFKSEKDFQKFLAEAKQKNTHAKLAEALEAAAAAQPATQPDELQIETAPAGEYSNDNTSTIQSIDRTVEDETAPAELDYEFIQDMFNDGLEDTEKRVRKAIDDAQTPVTKKLDTQGKKIDGTQEYLAGQISELAKSRAKLKEDADDPVYGVGESFKIGLKSAWYGITGRSEKAMTEYGERDKAKKESAQYTANEDFYVQTEKKFRGAEFEGKTDEEVSKLLKVEFAEQSKIIKQLADLEEKLSKYKEYGLDEKQIASTDEYKQHVEATGKLAKVGGVAFKGFVSKPNNSTLVSSDEPSFFNTEKDSISANELTAAGNDEQKFEASKLAEEQVINQEKQNVILGEQLELFTEEAENAQKRHEELVEVIEANAGGGGIASSLIDAGSSVLSKGAGIGMGTLAAGAAAGYGIYQAGQAIFTGRSDVNDALVSATGFDMGKETEGDKADALAETRKATEELNAKRVAEGKQPLLIDPKTGTGVAPNSPAGKKLQAEMSGNTLQGDTRAGTVEKLTEAAGPTKAGTISKLSTDPAADESTKMAEEIGKNIKVNVPPPTVVPSGDKGQKVLQAPFPTKINAQEPSISSYIKGRYR